VRLQLLLLFGKILNYNAMLEQQMRDGNRNGSERQGTERIKGDRRGYGK